MLHAAIGFDRVCQWLLAMSGDWFDGIGESGEEMMILVNSSDLYMHF